MKIRLYSLRFSAIFLTLTFFLLNGCTQQDSGNVSSEGSGEWSFGGSTMGTSYHVKVIPELANRQISVSSFKNELAAGIQKSLDEVDAKMSTYKEDSDVSLFNHMVEDNWLDIHPETLSVIKMGLDISRLSDGYFDMTVEPLVALWGFGPGRHKDKVPSKNQIIEAKAKTGLEKLIVDEKNSRIRKSAPVELDLSAIAKGFGVDQVALFLERKGVKRYLVEVGGEVRTSGKNKRNIAWQIGIEKPDVKSRTAYAVADVSNVAMATSGDYRNYFEKNGVRYSHAINPKTGYPIQHKLASVSIISDSCARADGLATAIFVMGEELGFKFAVENSIPAYFIFRQGKGFSQKFTPEFKPYLK